MTIKTRYNDDHDLVEIERNYQDDRVKFAIVKAGVTLAVRMSLEEARALTKGLH